MEILFKLYKFISNLFINFFCLFIINLFLTNLFIPYTKLYLIGIRFQNPRILLLLCWACTITCFKINTEIL